VLVTVQILISFAVLFMFILNFDFMVWVSYLDLLMLKSWSGFITGMCQCGLQGVDFLSGLRIVDFRVWISYLDVNFNYPNAVTRLTVDRASAYGTPTCVFSNQQFHWSPGGTSKAHSFSCWLCSMHAGALLPPQTYPCKSSLVCILNIFGAAILVRIAIKMSQCGLLVLIIVYLLRLFNVC
jgi:hypothetical protein